MTATINSILLVDDDTDDQMLFREALSEADNSISLYEASDGIDALEKLLLAVAQPKLILMDVNMPRMNGIDCLSAIRRNELFSGIPVVMYSTAYVYRDECLAQGAIDYIEKPHDYSRLCETVRDVVVKYFPK